MKKNSFVEGAFISTIGIVLCKILGIIYVIPFRAIIGTKGAILYSYAYTIYSVFASLSSTGIPSAMAKTVSEYNTLGYYDAQERAYKIGKQIIVLLGLISFIILFIFAPQISYLIIGDIEGGNTISDITFVIRVISTALLFIPILSISKGYVQGHRMMTVPAIANVIEQLIRVIVIVFGSFLTLKVFNLSITTAVGVATFGATVGAFVAYIYIINKINKNKEILKRNEKPKIEEKKLTNKVLFKRIVKYSLPFILIELIRSIYNTVDVFTVVRGLVGLGYDVYLAENILSIVTTWGSKLNMIILSVTFGLTISIIPNIVRSATLKDYKDVSNKINQTLKIIFFVSLPMTLGIWFLSSSVWTIFYGYDALSVNVFSFFILQTIINSFFYVLVDTTNALNNPKIALSTLLGSFILKAILNIPMMHFMKFIGIEAYYGIIATTMLVQFLSVIYLLYKLKKLYNINYKISLVPIIKIILINGIMILSLMIIRLLIGSFPTTRLYSLLEIIIYSIIGVIIYGLLSFKNNLFNEVFTEQFVNRFTKKFRR
ncbi:MAG TPA: polysaccharide biosynthesis protein [Candidatus Faecisoma merdavium]|nr:polysaccharide biosynthesis protein [Candidatus Faecisoma merdavium]